MQNQAQAGQRLTTAIINGLSLFYQIAGMDQPANFDYLVSTWSELLKEIPIENIDKAFKIALKENNRYKIPTVHQVLAANKRIVEATLNSVPVRQEIEKFDESEFPTKKQHENAMQTIQAVLDGRIDKKEGHGWLSKIFNNEV